MKVRPMLGDWEIPRIEAIRMGERRAFAELPVPGRTGSLFHDMDAWPSTVVVEGSLYGDEARDEFLEKVRERFREGEPVTFVADITTATTVRKVLIETLRFRQGARRPDEIRYHVELRESPPPPPEPDPAAKVDAAVQEKASGLASSAATAMDAVEGLGSVPSLKDPTGSLEKTVEDVKAATEGLSETTARLRSVLGGGEDEGDGEGDG